MLLPLVFPKDVGVLTRGLCQPPNVGELALPGGDVEVGEKAEDGAIRELLEETRIALPAGWPVKISHTRSTRNMLACFCVATPIPASLIPQPFTPTAEASEIKI